MGKGKYILITSILVLIVVASVILLNSNGNKITGDATQATLYKSSNCGCCSKYAPYLESKGFDLKIVIAEDIAKIKKEYGVPYDMESCHTLVIGDYFVEGHIPVEAIEKLLLEKPDIDGITLPGMPSGSPGMPGSKTEDFIIYSLKGGEQSEFLIL